MKKHSGTDLIRLLDQIARNYPCGIPARLVGSADTSTEEGENVGSEGQTYHLLVATPSNELPAEERSLLDNIVTKGLKISDRSLTVSCCPASTIEDQAASSKADKVVIFGAPRHQGWMPRSHGSPILCTKSLRELIETPELKREVWTSLQAIL